MTINLKLNTETLSFTVGLVIALFTFITLMWFPSVFVSALIALSLLIVAAFVGAMVTLGVYSVVNAINNSDDEDDDDFDDEE